MTTRFAAVCFRLLDRADGGHSGAIKTARVILMNSSFLSIVESAPRTFSATSADPRCSTQLDNSMMAASRASWFSLILRAGKGAGQSWAFWFPWQPRHQRSTLLHEECFNDWQDAGEGRNRSELWNAPTKVREHISKGRNFRKRQKRQSPE